MRRKYRIVVGTMALLLIAGEFAYWRIVVGRVRDGYYDWVTDLQAQGWNVSSGVPSIGGWPRSAAVAVSSLTLHHSGSAIPGDIEAVSAGVTLSVSLFSPTSLRISISGPVHLHVGESQDVVVIVDENWVSMPLMQGGSRAIDMHARTLRIEPAAGDWHATAGLLNANATITNGAKSDQSDSAATFSVSAEAIALPAIVRWPLGTNISSMSLDGVLNGPLPETRDITTWAQNWRDGGGSLAITHLTLGWGPLGLTSSATLALDDQLQPMGSGNGRMVGYSQTLDRLAAAGILTKSAATAAKAVLSLMAGSGGTDEPSAVDVPLTLQYRTLSMRQVPLLRLPELDWPPR